MTIVVVVVSGVCPFTASFTGAGDGCPRGVSGEVCPSHVDSREGVRAGLLPRA